MKILIILSVLIICIIGILSFQNIQQSNTEKKIAIDSLAAEREKFTNEILATIQGKESEMAISVFKNIKTFNEKENLKATHFLAVMNYWGEALGISCTHCHNTNDWASDEKQTKNKARGMYALRQIINKQISFEVENLKEIKPLVNCGTCHKGNKIPKEE
jgi:Photosynthetic reaction centre cytochrome C subunit